MSLDSRSRSSSISIERDLEEARQRLVLHQYDQEECNTENDVHVRTALEHPHGSGLPPTPLRHGNYGSVSTLQSIQQKAPPKVKRYRIPFLVLIAFDFGMVIFLSIICSEVSLGAHIHSDTIAWKSYYFLVLCKCVLESQGFIWGRRDRGVHLPWS